MDTSPSAKIFADHIGRIMRQDKIIEMFVKDGKYAYLHIPTEGNPMQSIVNTINALIVIYIASITENGTITTIPQSPDSLLTIKLSDKYTNKEEENYVRGVLQSIHNLFDFKQVIYNTSILSRCFAFIDNNL